MESRRQNPKYLDKVPEPVQPELLLPEVRRWVWLPFLLACANGLFLYGTPWLAETLYAWSIKPPINAAFMGAGYLTGVVASALALFAARYWRSVRILMWPFFGLGAGLLGATLLHSDKFSWLYPLTWAWTLVYFILPPGVILLWRRQERVVSPPPFVPADDGRLGFVRGLAGVLGVPVVAGAVALFISPQTFAENWPWPITPLLGRCFAAWYLLVGLTLVFVAVTARRRHELFIPGLTLVTFNFCLLLLPLLYAGSMRFGTLGFWLWLALDLILLGAGIFLTGQAFTRSRSEKYRLEI